MELILDDRYVYISNWKENSIRICIMVSKFCSIISYEALEEWITVDVYLFSYNPHPFRSGITRKDLDQNLGNKKSTIKENEDNETSAHNPRTCSEAVGMEKLIPSLRQRQQIGNPIDIHHAKTE